MLRTLRTWPEVRLAYEDRELLPAGPNSLALCGQPSAHLSGGGQGVNASFAWQFAGGQGEDQVCVDLESGWAKHSRLAHPARVLPLCGRSRVGGVVHGTAVLGIVCGSNQLSGCQGIAPEIAAMRLASYVPQLSAFASLPLLPDDDPSTPKPENVYAAVSHAIKFLDDANGAFPKSGGGVLLLEYETLGHLPLEALPLMRQLIESAIVADITVVEPAGNGGLKLDLVEDLAGTRTRIFERFHFGADSGAIMVGASRSDVTNNVQHERVSTSNFGSRLDCYAWGERIIAPAFQFGPGATLPGFLDRCGEFAETSGAAAIIAGVALVLQGIAAAHNVNLTPAELRDLLRKAANGTPCTASAQIGSMPDLARILKPSLRLGASLMARAAEPAHLILNTRPRAVSLRRVRRRRVDLARVHTATAGAPRRARSSGRTRRSTTCCPLHASGGDGSSDNFTRCRSLLAAFASV